MKHKRVKKKANKKTELSPKRRAAVFGISLAVLLAAFFIVMGLGGIFSPNSSDDGFEESLLVEPDKETGKINVLAIGLDKGGARTDTIIIVSYDLDDEKVNLLSIPRDTRMLIAGKYRKINCAYAVTKNGKKKGVNGTIEAVTRLTAIPINYYVEFTFETFREVVDALGGVDFDVPQDMNYDDPAQDLHIHLKKGQQHLDGDKAEQFVRFRRYPMGDIDRVKAQQSFMKALAEQKLNSSMVSKLPELFKVLQKDVKTNFNLADITKYALNLKELDSENINAYSLPGSANSEKYGASYWIADLAQVRTLVQDTFGYDASGITVGAADSKNGEKDENKSAKTENDDKKKTEETKTKASGEKDTQKSDAKKTEKTAENKTEKTDEKKSEKSSEGSTQKKEEKEKSAEDKAERSEDKEGEKTADNGAGKTDEKKSDKPLDAGTAAPEVKNTEPSAESKAEKAEEAKPDPAETDKPARAEEPPKTEEKPPVEEKDTAREIKRPSANTSAEE